MYLTAHRVRHESGATGYNGFLYLHGDEPIVTDLESEEVGETPPGDCVAKTISVPPGGNSVDSYIDVVVPDQFSEERLADELGRIGAQLESDLVEEAIVFDEGDVGVRFVSTDRVPGSTRDEFDRLSNVVVALHRQLAEGKTDSALVIEESRTADGRRYTLAAETESEFGAEHDRLFPVEVDRNTLDALQSKHGPIYPLLVDLIVPPDVEVPDRFSHVVVADSESGEVRWRSDTP